VGSASLPSTDQLTGSWATGTLTCAQQNAAVVAAGITAEDMARGGWSPTCADGMVAGSQFTIHFGAGRLIIFQDGDQGWGGTYRIFDGDKFEARDPENGDIITYKFAINGDQLTVDVIGLACPSCYAAGEWEGGRIAMVVIFETSPFTRSN
jgi:hypothetical protein